MPAHHPAPTAVAITAMLLVVAGASVLGGCVDEEPNYIRETEFGSAMSSSSYNTSESINCSFWLENIDAFDGKVAPFIVGGTLILNLTYPNEKWLIYSINNWDVQEKDLILLKPGERTKITIDLLDYYRIPTGHYILTCIYEYLVDDMNCYKSQIHNHVGDFTVE